MNRHEYLKRAFSYDLSYESGKLIADRRDFLAGENSGTSAEALTQRQELYWQLQEFRDEFWTLSNKQRVKRINELSHSAPPEFKISLKHLKKVRNLEQELKKLEEDLDFDPLFVERLKNRLLWNDKAVPDSLELRTAVPAKTNSEFKKIQKSVAVLRNNYPQLARFLPRWLRMIETSKLTLEQSPAAPNSRTNRQPSFFNTETKVENLTEPSRTKPDEEGCGFYLVLFLIFLLVKFIVLFTKL